MARHQKPYKKSLTANRNDFNNNGMNDSIFGMNDSVLSINDKCKDKKSFKKNSEELILRVFFNINII